MTILNELGIPFAKDEDLPTIVKLTTKALKLVPDNLFKSDGTEKTITVLLNNLSSMGHQLGRLAPADREPPPMEKLGEQLFRK